MIRITGVRAPIKYDDAFLWDSAQRLLRIKRGQIRSLRLTRRSVDARDKGDIHFSLNIDIEVDGDEAAIAGRCRQAAMVSGREYAPPVRVERGSAKRPVVVGFGPAGMFAALTLAMAGLEPIVIERGKPVDERAADVELLQQAGVLNEESNILFGEGGAGAFSDGKLTTGIKDGRCALALKYLYEAGAPEEILYQAKPHIGTDLLRGVVKNIRHRIIGLGGEVRFGAKLTGLVVHNGRIAAARVQSADGEYVVECDALILAIGHSARDTYKMLHATGVELQPKAFSIGARIEHRQEMINVAQYGALGRDPDIIKRLGAAEYKLSRQLSNGRGAYTFCMCPGGSVVCSASESGLVATNGMSLHARAGENANSALLVSVTPDDFGSSDPLAGIEFQRRYERLAFERSGGGYKAPAQRVEDFLKNRASIGFGEVTPSFLPGVVPANLADCLPAFAVESMRMALPHLGRQLRGFDHPDAVLTGVETRSSAPVRIPRGPDGSAAIAGLYPTGEGAGWAGGIMSAAVDGIRQGESVVTLVRQDSYTL